jgi:diguanylate cyclase (GGDEF)-like protein
LFLAICAGWWFKERFFGTPGLKDEQIQQLWGRMQEFSADVALNVDEHSKRVGQLSQELDTLQSSGDEPERQSAERDIVAQILAANKQLHEQLAASERRIQEQVQTIHSMSTETRSDSAETQIDTLTNLANRQTFDEEFARRFAAWQCGRDPLSLVLVGLDHWRDIQETHGQEAGNEILSEVGKTLAARVRKMDVIARYGESEFIIILPETTVDGGKGLAERHRAAVQAAKIKFEEQVLDVTISVGVAEVQASDDMASFLGHADLALSAAKQNGRNRGYFYNGRGCHPIVPGGVGEALHDNQSEAARTKLTTDDLRAHARKLFLRTELIAPYIGARFPAQDEFSEIQCFDISVGGISYFLPKPPDHQTYVLALGQAPHLIYTKAQVVRVAMTKLHTMPMYIVGCQFTGRIERPGKTPPALASAGSKN